MFFNFYFQHEALDISSFIQCNFERLIRINFSIILCPFDKKTNFFKIRLTYAIEDEAFSETKSDVSNWRNRTLTYKITIRRIGTRIAHPFSRDVINGSKKSSEWPGTQERIKWKKKRKKKKTEPLLDVSSNPVLWYELYIPVYIYI